MIFSRTSSPKYGDGFSISLLVTVVLFLAGGSVTAQEPSVNETGGQVLDRINFGSTGSERRHQFEATNTEGFPGSREQEPISGVHVTSTSASSGSAPENTLVEEGEWSGSKGEWIQYQLSEPTKL